MKYLSFIFSIAVVMLFIYSVIITVTSDGRRKDMYELGLVHGAAYALTYDSYPSKWLRPKMWQNRNKNWVKSDRTEIRKFWDSIYPSTRIIDEVPALDIFQLRGVSDTIVRLYAADEGKTMTQKQYKDLVKMIHDGFKNLEPPANPYANWGRGVITVPGEIIFDHDTILHLTQKLHDSLRNSK